MAGTAVYALTRQGLALGADLARRLPGVLFAPERMAAEFAAEPFAELLPLVRERFRDFSGHVFVCAAGIAVRAVAPLLASKAGDPAVVVLDQAGRHVVSLVSGHLGGANDLARRVADITGGEAVITTATDTAGLPSPDVLAQSAGLRIKDLGRAKLVSGALLGGEPVQLLDPQGWLDAAGWRAKWPDIFQEVNDPLEWDGAGPGIVVTHAADCMGLDHDACLVLRPPSLCLGMGCRKGVPGDELLAFVRQEFAQRNLSLDCVWKLGTVEAKRSDVGLTELARSLGVKLAFFDADELNAAGAPHPSPGARKHLGVDSVCEAAAMLLAGTTSLLVPKQSTSRATLAVALRGTFQP